MAIMLGDRKEVYTILIGGENMKHNCIDKGGEVLNIDGSRLIKCLNKEKAEQ